MILCPMEKVFQRICKGYRERPGASLFYSFLIYLFIAIALVLASPTFSGSTPGKLTDEERGDGMVLTVIVLFLAGLGGGWFAVKK